MNFNKHLKPAFVVASILALAACDGDDGDTVVSSESINTNRFYATIDVYSDSENKVSSSVQFTIDTPPRENKPGDEYIKLLAGDQLWMSTGVNIEEVQLGDDLFSGLQDLSKTQELFEGESRGYEIYPLFPFFFFWSELRETHIHYNGELNDVDDGATYTVSLFRNSKEDAKDSTVTMPLPFAITAPQSTDRISRSNDEIQVEWLPMEEGVSVQASFNTSCPLYGSTDYETVLEDDGVLRIRTEDLVPKNYGGECNTTLTLVKQKIGSLDTAFIGGYITANQVRTVSFTTID